MYAVDTSDIITLARAIAARSGLEAVIDFRETSSLTLEIPERVDLVVSDLRGTLPLFGDALQTLADARQRLLADNGIMIPASDRIFIAGVSSERLYLQTVSPGAEILPHLDLGPIIDKLANQLHKKSVLSSEVCLPGQPLWSLDYRDLDHQSDRTATAEWRCQEGGMLHGFVVWFDSTLFDDVELTNAPGAPPTNYGHLFIPLRSPLAYQPGQIVAVDLKARHDAGTYHWEWNASIC